MPSRQQETFRQMIDHVLGDFPHYPEQLVERSINDHLQKLIAKRPWSGLTQYGLLAVPDEVRDGTVTTTLGSNVVTGVGTGWAVNDKANTTVSVTTTETGFCQRARPRRNDRTALFDGFAVSHRFQLTLRHCDRGFFVNSALAGKGVGQW